MPRTRISEAQRREMQFAADNHFGLVRPPLGRPGFAAAQWRRMMNRTCAFGWMRETAYGDFEITGLGRSALSGGDKRND